VVPPGPPPPPVPPTPPAPPGGAGDGPGAPGGPGGPGGPAWGPPLGGPGWRHGHGGHGPPGGPPGHGGHGGHGRPGPVGPPPGRSWWHTPLQRPQEGRDIAGVMRGLANAYGFDVKPWRIVLVIASIMFPPLVAAYIVAWVAIPEEPAPPRSPAELSRTGSGA